MLTVHPSAWLLSVAAELGEAKNKRAVLHGYDITSVHYPAADDLPANISLETLDAFNEELPEAMVGKYDVVHVRVFTAVVKNNDPSPLIRNALKMLKPGGYLQWDEMDSETLGAVSPKPSISSTCTQEMTDTGLLSSKNAMNLRYDWSSNLGSIFAEHGLEVVEDTRMDVKKELRKAMTDSLLMMFEHVATLAVRDGCMVGTDKNWADLWNKAGQEIDNGVSITMQMMVRVGRKPA